MNHLGQTRSAHRRNYTLHTPDSFVRTSLPGLTGGMAIVHASPAGGAAFAQYTLELDAGGVFGTSGLMGVQRFVYVISGKVNLASDGQIQKLGAGCFAYLPAGVQNAFSATEATVLQVIEKTFSVLEGSLSPQLVTGFEPEIMSIALGGDPGIQVRPLMPTDSSYDFAVNTMTYSPGAALSQVEVHVMEHGLMMLEGGGIYRLGKEWYPVTTGDFIWMGAYCPQWFGAIGKTSAKYLIYKDFNRHPLA